MHLLSSPLFSLYWSGSFLEANFLIGLNLLGALLLGMVVGYERSYHGRAAGMRTYALVCVASTALTVFVGYSHFWYAGAGPAVTPDPTRVVQGIVSGIGFLCAGCIMKDGLSISGLTTAASIWAASAIGVLLGVGFYGSAIFLAVLCAASMSLMVKLENWLPTRTALGISLTFRQGFIPKADVLSRAAQARGYRFVADSLSITYEGGQSVWKFMAVTQDQNRLMSPGELAEELSSFDGVVSFNISHARN